ncbi:MAG: DUF4202 domain-containing protein [Akkermansiaceae bacterium]
MSLPFQFDLPRERITDPDRFDLVLDRFDAINHEDWQRIVYHGQSYPAEYLLAQALCHRVLQLAPQPSEPLLLASRCQHLRRWERPRTSNPDGRKGYLKWRKDLKVFHARIVGKILEEAGYDEDLRSAVKELNLKTHIKDNPDCQTLEDGLCLVFLQFQIEDIIVRYPEATVVGLLKKTAAKMSPTGLAAAQELNYSEAGRNALRQALS